MSNFEVEYEPKTPECPEGSVITWCNLCNKYEKVNTKKWNPTKPPWTEKGPVDYWVWERIVEVHGSYNEWVNKGKPDVF